MTDNPDTWPLFLSAARSLEPQLADEATALGANDARVMRGGVRCSADLATLYRLCHRARLVSRVLLPLAEFAAGDEAALYAGTVDVDWSNHLSAGATIAVDFTSSRSKLTHSRFGAQRVKDGIVDNLRAARGERPDVDRAQPDCRINAYLFDNRLSLSLDLGGGALHRRPWLAEGGRPALPANVAAALLQKLGWPDTNAASPSLISLWGQDATLAIEAAEIAGGLAANRDRTHWGFFGWQHHDDSVWAAEQQSTLGPAPHFDPDIVVIEPDRRRAAVARAAVSASGLDIAVENANPIDWLNTTSLAPQSTVLATPLDAAAEDPSLLSALGQCFKQRALGCSAGVLVSTPEHGKQLGFRAHKRNQYQVADDTHSWFQFSLSEENVVDREAAAERQRAREHSDALARGADALMNRIAKNQRTLGKWAQRSGISCYRLYDADLPEYALAIDIYEDHAHIQEYAAPSSIDPERAAQRLIDAKAVLPGALGIAPDHCVFKERRRQRGDAQYRKHANSGEFMRVTEAGATFAVNLHDYLDTGLFLDHRDTRALVASMAHGKSLLNLFGYTGSVTVQAALAGATSSLTVDLSQTYLDWAGRNFSLNKLGPEHRLERADVLTWLNTHREHYDLIFLDPPTFSNSKSMADTFDVQRDHVAVIRDALSCLAPGGTLVFSNNNRRFKLDTDALADCQIENISRKTLPRDFQRNPKIHNVWLIQAAAL